MPIFQTVLFSAVFLLCFAGGVELCPKPVGMAQAVAVWQWPVGGAFEESLNTGYERWLAGDNNVGVSKPLSDEISSLESEKSILQEILNRLQTDAKYVKEQDAKLSKLKSESSNAGDAIKARQSLQQLLDHAQGGDFSSKSFEEKLKMGKEIQNATEKLKEELNKAKEKSAKQGKVGK